MRWSLLARWYYIFWQLATLGSIDSPTFGRGYLTSHAGLNGLLQALSRCIILRLAVHLFVWRWRLFSGRSARIDYPFACVRSETLANRAADYLSAAAGRLRFHVDLLMVGYAGVALAVAHWHLPSGL